MVKEGLQHAVCNAVAGFNEVMNRGELNNVAAMFTMVSYLSLD